MKVLSWINKHLVVSILISMVIGLLIGSFLDTSVLRGAVIPLSFFMVYPMMVTLNFKSLFEKGSLKLQVVTQMINFIYLPLLAILFGLIFFRYELNFRLGILLIALLPTSGMTVSWTVMAKGNVKEAIRMIVIGLILAGILTPITIGLVFRETIEIEMMSILIQIFLIVFLPMLLGFITQRLLIYTKGQASFSTQYKPVFPLFSTLSVVILIAIVMSFRAQMLLSNPVILIRLLIPITLGYLIMLITVHWLGKWLFNDADRIALINGTMIRSLSLALAIALTVFETAGPEIALVIAIAYIVQVQLAAWYVKREIKLQSISTVSG